MASPLNGCSTHVLVLDNDPETLQAVRRRLEPEGYRVTMSSADWGVELAIAVFRPDVILLDPLASDVVWEGLPRLLRMQSAIGAAPIVLHSAAPVETLESAIDLRGALGVIAKTSDDLEFVFAFNGLLDLRREALPTRAAANGGDSGRSGTHMLGIDECVVEEQTMLRAVSGKRQR